MRSGFITQSVRNYSERYKYEISANIPQGLNCYVIGATLLPFEGATFGGYWTAEGEATRQQFNAWVRTSGEHDGVIDFDATLRDPAHPTKLLPQYDSGDHLHPSDIGYMAMAAIIDLELFDLEP